MSQSEIRKELTNWIVKRFEGDTVKPTYNYVVDQMIDMCGFTSLEEAQDAARNNVIEGAVKAYYLRMAELARHARQCQARSIVLCSE